jgi:hypothetical protein
VKTLEMAHAVAPLAEYAQDVNQEPLILTVRGKPVIERSRVRHKVEGGISSAEMRRRLSL